MMFKLLLLAVEKKLNFVWQYKFKMNFIFGLQNKASNGIRGIISVNMIVLHLLYSRNVMQFS